MLFGVNMTKNDTKRETLVTENPDEVRLTLRMPAGVRAHLTNMAKANGRSLNAEIVGRLERTITEETEYGNIYEFTGELDQRLEKLESTVQKIKHRIDSGEFNYLGP